MIRDAMTLFMIALDYICRGTSVRTSRSPAIVRNVLRRRIDRFLHGHPGYSDWLADHPRGYVLTLRGHDVPPMLHRADCLTSPLVGNNTRWRVSVRSAAHRSGRRLNSSLTRNMPFRNSDSVSNVHAARLSGRAPSSRASKHSGVRQRGASRPGNRATGHSNKIGAWVMNSKFKMQNFLTR